MNLNLQLALLLCLTGVAAISIFISSTKFAILKKYYSGYYFAKNSEIYSIREEIGMIDLNKCDHLNFTLIYGKYDGISYILSQEMNNKSHDNKTQCTLPVVILHENNEELKKYFDNLNTVIIIDLEGSRIFNKGLGIINITIPKVTYLPLGKHLSKIVPLRKNGHLEMLNGTSLIVERILECFQRGVIPVLIANNFYLPFSEVLEWEDALLRNTHSTNLSLTKATLFKLRRVGFLIYQRYFSSKERFIDFVLAAIQHKLGHTPPFHKDVILDYFPKNDNFLLNKPKHQYPMTAEESKYLWNVAFFPWRRTPIHFLGQTDHRMDRYVNGYTGYNDSEQFTVVIILWNNPDTNPNTDPNIFNLLATVATEDYPPVVIARTTKNSLNNRLLPLELIMTDCVFHVDDDTRHLNSSIILSGFKTWQENRGNLVGFQARHVKMSKRGKWKYYMDKSKTSIVLIGSLFHHKFYSYKYTYEMSPSLLSKVDELMNCEDIFLNGLVQATTGLPPLMAGKNRDYNCNKPCEKNGQKGLHNQVGHYKERDYCVTLLEEHYGYLPLITTKVISKAL